MTTIACDGKCIAGDGRGLVDGVIITDARDKLFSLSDGRAGGSSGEGPDITRFAEWLEGGAKGKMHVSRDFCGLVLEPGGKVIRYTNDGVPLEVAPPIATGSGMEFAIGAMEAGASAEEAVRIAAKRDTGTGGTITVLYVEPRQ